jgi:hypothetical protein
MLFKDQKPREKNTVRRDGPALPWYWVWFRALVQPSVETYKTLITDPQATPRRAYIWIFVATTVSFALYLSAGALAGREDAAGQAWCMPSIGLFGLLFFIVGAWVENFLADLVYGRGVYWQQAYALAAFIAPLLILVGLLIPLQGYLFLPLAAYGVLLNILVTRAIHDLSWGQAIVAAWVPVGVTCGCLFGVLAVGA